MGRPLIDIAGKKYGRLTVTDTKKLVGKHTMWNCLCDCGNNVAVAGENLRSGKQSSCGCFQKEPENNPAFVHGECRKTVGKTKEYAAYQSAKGRCTNTNIEAYSEYGGRGIKFLFVSYAQWFSELGRAPSASHSVDRIDNNGNYEPGNVRWATKGEQIKNRREFKTLSKFSTEELKTELLRRGENV